MVQIKNFFMAITLSLSVIGCVSLPDESKSNSENIVVPNTPTPERDILATLDAIDQLIIAARMTAMAPTSTPVPVVDPTCTNRYSPTIPTVYLSSTTACKTANVTITWDVEKGTSNYFMNINLNNLSPYDYANGHIKFRIWNQNKTQYVDWYKRITPVHRATIDEVGLSDFRELIPNTIMTVGEIQLTRFDVGDY